MTDAQKLKLLTMALEFYAEPETYFGIALVGDPPCGDFLRDCSMTFLDRKPGKRARAALKKVYGVDLSQPPGP